MLSGRGLLRGWVWLAKVLFNIKLKNNIIIISIKLLFNKEIKFVSFESKQETLASSFYDFIGFLINEIYQILQKNPDFAKLTETRYKIS